MNDEVYLIFSRRGINRLIKKPNKSSKATLQKGELMVKVRLMVDDKYFDYAAPEAVIKLDSTNLVVPEVKIEPIKIEEPKSIMEIMDGAPQ